MVVNFLTPKGEIVVTAFVGDDFDYINCPYKVYRNGEVMAAVEGYSELLLFLVRKFDFSTSEIEFAVEEMARNDHDTAYFGIFGTLLFTSEESPADVKQVM